MKKVDKIANNKKFDTISYVRNEKEKLSKLFSKMTNKEIINYLKESSSKNSIRPSA